MATKKSAPSRKARRPDGTDQDRYSGIKKWTYRRWAWEFLRRNEQFIAACKDARPTSEQNRIAVAQQFGLKAFKDYREAYKGISGRPRFALGSIKSWSHMPDSKDSRRVAITLMPGQVLIRFDVGSAARDSNVLAKQIRLANIRLEKRLAKQRDMLNKIEKEGAHKSGLFGQFLRVLDALAAGKTPLECALVISPNKARKLKNGEIEKFDIHSPIGKKIARAKLYTEELYLALAVLKGRPRAKAFPLVAQ